MSKERLDRKIVKTEDGSHTLFIPELNENYHSMHGAVQESKHVFIEAGLAYLKEKNNINILEIGFGTGLNAFLAYICSKADNKNIFYQSIEKYPLVPAEYNLLNYAKKTEPDLENIFHLMHTCNWHEDVQITQNFILHKIKADLITFNFNKLYDIVFFDAFAPEIQPGLWTVEVFKKMYNTLNSGGTLTTYSAKGQVRRDMISAGFVVERLKGPPGKREMLRALKN